MGLRTPKPPAKRGQANKPKESASPASRPPKKPQKPGPSRTEIIKAEREGVAGRPPLYLWTDADVRRFRPSSLSDAELVCMWLRYPRFEPNVVNYRQLIERGLWRAVLSRRKYISARQMEMLIEALKGPGDHSKAFSVERKAIIDVGLRGFLEASISEYYRQFSESHPAIVFPVPEELYLPKAQTSPAATVPPPEVLPPEPIKLSPEQQIELKRQSYSRLAKYLCAAYIADQHGITIGYAFKQYGDKEIGAYWYALAESVRHDVDAAMTERFKEVFKPPTVQ